jgi:uncharacterized protein YqjF (DUF2071 family)
VTTPFLTAAWRKLVLFNYAIDAHHLHAYVPYGTELNTYNGTCYLSLVGFMFEDVKMLGVPVPFHQSFEEVNLRFYVKHITKNGAERKGVVFLREFAPKVMLELVANSVFHEHYETLKMDHTFFERKEELELEYRVHKDIWYSMRVTADKTAHEIPAACEEEFITEHTWGYTAISKYTTNEYEVWHPRWKMHPVKSYALNYDFTNLYGEEFAFLNSMKPFSVMLAEGSEIKLWKGNTIG